LTEDFDSESGLPLATAFVLNLRELKFTAARVFLALPSSLTVSLAVNLLDLFFVNFGDLT
jgi:hypothetical protein